MKTTPDHSQFLSEPVDARGSPVTLGTKFRWFSNCTLRHTYFWDCVNAIRQFKARGLAAGTYQYVQSSVFDQDQQADTTEFMENLAEEVAE